MKGANNKTTLFFREGLLAIDSVRLDTKALPLLNEADANDEGDGDGMNNHLKLLFFI